LKEGELRRWEAEVRDDAPKIRVGIIEGAKHVDHLPVVEAEAGHVLQQLHVRHPAQGPVVQRPQRAKRGGLLALRLHANHDAVPLLPLGDEVRQQLGGILEIRRHDDGGVSPRLQQAVVGRADVAEVPGVQDHLDAVIRLREPSKQPSRPVRRAVVDEEQLEVIPAAERHDGSHHPLIELGDVVFLVEARHQDGDSFHDELRVSRWVK